MGGGGVTVKFAQVLPWPYVLLFWCYNPNVENRIYKRKYSEEFTSIHKLPGFQTGIYYLIIV